MRYFLARWIVAAHEPHPHNAVALLDEYGRWRHDPVAHVPSGVRPGVEDPAFYLSFMKASESDPARFARELADLTADRGDWATVGAARLITEELNAVERDDPNYHRLMHATLEYFDRRGEIPNALTGFENDFRRRHGS